jgi:urea transport system ATP-binding protein
MLNVSDLQVYYGQSRILNGVDIEVPSGQVVCLMGRNGVGKTTLLKSIMGLVRAKAGSISFNDTDITRMAPHRRAQAGIGYVPQGRGIFPHLTVLENLVMGFEALNRQQPKEAQAAIDEVCGVFPILWQMRKRAAGTLSGGQQQQLAIGRVLVRRPTLLLLDEPTEGIQPNIVQEIEDVIHALREKKNIAILLIEQFLDFALGIADTCYVMEKGQIVSKGSAKELDTEIVREHLSV